MRSGVTLSRRTPTTDAVVSRDSLGLAAEVAEKARGRVRRIAVLLTAVGCFGLLVGVVTGWLLGTLARDLAVQQVIGSGLCTALSFGLWQVARNERFGHVTVLNLALAFEVVLCFGAAMGAANWHAGALGMMPYMSWTTPLIILFPLIVPCPPTRMLVASLAAAATEPLTLVIMASRYPDLNPDTFPSTTINASFAVIVAYFSSRIIYGLNVDAAKARRLGAYQLEERLGAGGMGEVWRARHRMLARPAAIKLIRPDVLGSASEGGRTLLERFEHEAQATASLRSPHTIEVYDFGLSQDGTFFYVMELLDGIDLQKLVDQDGPQPPERVIHLLSQACHSLHEAHQAGMVHRDIKPANLFVCRYGLDLDFVKVLDFGLVKEQQIRGTAAATLTECGTIIGTPGFMAPEVALGKEGVDGRADLYALGCVGYWLLTGSMLFEVATPMDMVVKHVTEAPEPLASSRWPTAASKRSLPSSIAPS